MEENRMRVVTGLLVLLPILASAPANAQTARQGDTTVGSEGYREFRSPMVLEIAYPVEMGRLRLFRCDKISIISLGFTQRRLPSAREEINTKVKLFNPDQSHDKKVTLLFEFLNGDAVAGSFELQAVKVKEDAMVTKTVKTVVPDSALVIEPETRVRITMRTWDY
jgi:hypothetical protein